MDEFGDSIEAGGADLEKDNKKQRQAQQEDSGSFDLDNSDDLNRFIQKYETMLDGDKKSGSKLSDLGLAKQGSGAKPKTLAKNKSNKDLEDSWGSLQLQAEQMLGESPIEDETALSKKAESTGTVSAAAQHRIEEEILAEEIKRAQQ